MFIFQVKKDGGHEKCNQKKITCNIRNNKSTSIIIKWNDKKERRVKNNEGIKRTNEIKQWGSNNT